CDICYKIEKDFGYAFKRTAAYTRDTIRKDAEMEMLRSTLSFVILGLALFIGACGTPAEEVADTVPASDSRTVRLDARASTDPIVAARTADSVVKGEDSSNSAFTK